ncbi:MAG: hypothetical protein KatS3mg003_0300 [Candidatus Nitrosocaldaceae archaeon]|nr:MAG: hypothetical protein KatS3mg003_0300 [Candidatus Nitrosocaldaceae archaeon]
MKYKYLVIDMERINTIDELMDYLLNELELYDLEKREIKPLTHIIETEDEVIVTLDLPCISKKDISIKGTEDTLIIKASCNSKIRLPELNTEFNGYSKSIRLPTKVEPRHAKAYFNNGVLQIRLPKKIEGKEIEVD